MRISIESQGTKLIVERADETVAYYSVTWVSSDQEYALQESCYQEKDTNNLLKQAIKAAKAEKKISRLNLASLLFSLNRPNPTRHKDKTNESTYRL